MAEYYPSQIDYRLSTGRDMSCGSMGRRNNIAVEKSTNAVSVFYCIIM